MKSFRFVIMLALLALPAHFALAQEAPFGEAVGEEDEPIGGEDVEGEAAGEGDEPIGGEPLY